MPAAPGLTPFVGRARELRALDERLEVARAGVGAVVLIAGEAGIGKTRLVAEAAENAATHGWRVLAGRALELEGAAPYAPFSEALEPFVREAHEAELRRTLGDGAGDVALVVPSVRQRLPGTETVSLASESERQRLLEHLTNFIAAIAATPTILIIEDLHWVDPAALAVIAKLAVRAASVPLVLIGTYRDNEVVGEHPAAALVSELQRRPETDLIHLSGLDERDIVELLSVYDAQGAAPALPRILLEETGGNALFLTETVRLLAAEGRFQEEQGARNAGRWRLATLPNVGQVIIRRTKFLPEDSRRLLRFGAVCGREFDLNVLAQVPDLRTLDLLDAVATAEQARLVQSLPGAAGRYQFAHPLVREAIYNDAPSVERIRLHRDVGLTLERLAGPDASIQASNLAYHFLQALPAGESQRAIRYSHLAGDQAMRQFAYEGAELQYRAALELLAFHDPGNRAERCALLLGRAEAISRSGETPVSRALYQEVAELAESIGAHEQLVQAALGHAGYRAAYASVERTSLNLLERALKSLGGGETRMRAQVMARLAMELYYTRERDRRVALSDEALALARADGDASTLALVLKGRHYALHEPENTDERLSVAVEMIRIAEQAGDSELALQGHYLAVYDLLEIGDMEGANYHLAEHCRLGETNRQPLYLWRSELLLGMRDMFEGRFAESERRIFAAYQIAERARIPNAQVGLGGQLNSLRLMQRRPAEMVPSIRAAVAVTGSTLYRAVLGMFEAELGNLEAVESEMAILSADDFHAIDWGEDFFIDGYSLVQMCVALCGATGAEKSDTAARSSNIARAARLYELMSPYPDRMVVVSGSLSCMGPVARLLGQLAVLLERWDEASAHLEEAIRRSAAMGPNVWTLYSEYDRAWMLARRDRTGDAERAAAALPLIIERANELGLGAIAYNAGRLYAALTERTGRLSARETDVLIRMAAGATNKEIAVALKIGTRTVDSHVERIYQKLGARGRADAIAYALQAGLADSTRPPA